jgi:PAS domain S-box-containing protein
MEFGQKQWAGVQLTSEFSLSARAHVFCGVRAGARYLVALDLSADGTPNPASRWEFRSFAYARLRVASKFLPKLTDVVDDPTGTALIFDDPPGICLSEWIDANPVHIETALAIVSDCARALSALHSAGILHRQIELRAFRIAPKQRITLLDFPPIFRSFHSSATRYPDLDVSDSGEKRSTTLDTDLPGLGEVMRTLLDRVGRQGIQSAAELCTFEELGRIANRLTHVNAHRRYPSAASLIHDLHLIGRVLGDQRTRKTISLGLADPFARDWMMVGRSAERYEVLRFIQTHLDSQRNVAAFLVGPAGIGRSTLMRTLALELLRRNLLLVAVEPTSEIVPPPCAAVVDGIRCLLARCKDTEFGMDLSARLTYLQRSTREALQSIFHEHLRFQCADTNNGAQPAPVVEAALAELIEVLLDFGPVGFCVAGFGEIDQGSRRLLRRILSCSSTHGAFMIATANSAQANDSSAELRTICDATLVTELEYLPKHEALALISHALGGHSTSPELLATIFESGGTNPADLRELCSTAAARADFCLRDGVLALSNEGRHRIRQAIESSNGARNLNALTPGTLYLAAALAVLDRPSTLNEIGAILEFDDHAIAMALAEARHKDVILVSPNGKYSLATSRIRVALQSAISSERLAQYHAKAAALISQRLANSDADSSNLILARARHLRAALPHADVREVMAANEEALHSLLAQDAYRHAGDCVQILCKLARDFNLAESNRLLLDLADYYRLVGKCATAIATLDRALLQIVDPIERVRCLRISGFVHILVYDFAKAADRVALALRALHTSRKRFRPWPQYGEDKATRTLWLKEAAQIQILQYRLECYAKPRPDRVLKIVQRLSRIAVALDDNRLRARALTAEAYSCSIRGHFAKGRRLYARALRVAHASNLSALVGQTSQHVAIGLLDCGRFREGMRSATKIVSFWRWIGDSEALVSAVFIALANVVRGRAFEAARWHRLALEMLPDGVDGEKIQLSAGSLDVLALGATECGAQEQLSLHRKKQRQIEESDLDEDNALPMIANLHQALGESQRVQVLGENFRTYLARYSAERRPILLYQLVVLCFGARVLINNLYLAKNAALRDIPTLRKIASLLGRGSPDPIARAYAEIIQIHIALFTGRLRLAKRALMRAQILASSLDVPWIAFEMLRAEGHYLRHNDREAAARNAAICAQAIAAENGASPLKWTIIREFGIRPLNQNLRLPTDDLLHVARPNTTGWLRPKALARRSALNVAELGTNLDIPPILESISRRIDALEVGLFAFATEDRATKATPAISFFPALETNQRPLHEKVAQVAHGSATFEAHASEPGYTFRIDNEHSPLRCMALVPRPHALLVLTLMFEHANEADAKGSEIEGILREIRPFAASIYAALRGDHVSDEYSQARHAAISRIGYESMLADRYRELFESSSEAVFLLEAGAGTILDLNRMASEYSGWSKQRALGKHHSELFPEASRPDCDDAFVRGLRSGRATLESQTLVDESGRSLPVSLEFRTLAESANSYVLLTIQDQREHERIRERLRQLQKMEAIGRLSGGVAHDFNNMLTVVDRAVDSLESADASAQEKQRDIAMIRETVARASALTRKLLTFSAQRNPTLSTIDLNAAISGLSEMFRRIIGDAISLHVELDPQPCIIRIDQSELEQVLLNLVVNAADAMAQGGKLSLRTSRTGSSSRDYEQHERRVILEISDTGGGIDSEVLPKIFEPFFTTKREGTGLGLATVYGIVNGAHGSIEVESSPQQGTRFMISLPYESTLAPDPTPIESIHEVISCPAKQVAILYVEDDDNVRPMVARALERLGHQVVAVNRPEHAISIVRAGSQPIGLVVTDVLMPGMNGPKMVEEILKYAPHLRVLYVSGYSGAEEKSGDFGWPHGTMLLRKPFSLAALSRAVADAVGRSPEAPSLRTAFVADKPSANEARGMPN